MFLIVNPGGGGKNQPVAYVSGSKPKVKAVVTSDCGKDIDIWLKGTATVVFNNGSSSTFQFPAQKCKKNGNKYTYDYKDADAAFALNNVAHIPEFTIKWDIKYEETGTWSYLADSKVPMYVTHKEPVLLTRPEHREPTKVYLTLLDIGCRNANGSSSEQLIVDQIFVKFESRDIRRVDGVGPIKYWGDPAVGGTAPACWQPSQMLKTLDGVCGGWAPFFENVLCIQGITSSKIIIPNWDFKLTNTQLNALKADFEAYFGQGSWNPAFPVTTDDVSAGPVAYFYIENWALSANVKFVVNDILNVVNGNPLWEPLTDMGIIPIAEGDGVSGQGNSDPRSEFSDHGFVEYNSRVYDPSYGESFESRDEWEASAVAGMGAILSLTLQDDSGNNRMLFINWVSVIEDSNIPGELKFD